jgi:hypothetical protein
MSQRASATYGYDFLEWSVKYWEQITVNEKNNATVKHYPAFQSTFNKNVLFNLLRDSATVDGI